MSFTNSNKVKKKFLFYNIPIEYRDSYIAVAQGRGPPDLMKEVENSQTRPKGVPLIKISENSESWDLQALVAIFHDFHDSLFVEDFNPMVKAKSLLLGIKDIRNKRAHDNPVSARDVYRLSDLAE